MITAKEALIVSDRSLKNLINSQIKEVEDRIKRTAESGQKRYIYYTDSELKEQTIAAIESSGFKITRIYPSHHSFSTYNYRYDISWED